MASSKVYKQCMLSYEIGEIKDNPIHCMTICYLAGRPLQQQRLHFEDLCDALGKEIFNVMVENVMTEKDVQKCHYGKRSPRECKNNQIRVFLEFGRKLKSIMKVCLSGSEYPSKQYKKLC